MHDIEKQQFKRDVRACDDHFYLSQLNDLFKSLASVQYEIEKRHGIDYEAPGMTELAIWTRDEINCFRT